MDINRQRTLNEQAFLNKKVIFQLHLPSNGDAGLKPLKALHTLSLIIAILTILIAQKTLFPQRMIQEVSAVSTANIGVYWNQNCTNPVTAIKWGTLSPGENKTITLYVQNQDNTTITLNITPTNWNPQNAQESLTFSWTTTNATIEPQKTAKITLTLNVKQNITNIKEFSFDIIFEGKAQAFLPTDVNRDGIVDLVDIVIVARAFGSQPGDARWNEAADINKDGCIDMLDIVAVVADYGKTS